MGFGSKFFLLLAILIVTLQLKNNATYIRQNGRPLNIAHRGLCSILPENTLEAFEAALYQGADFIEMDVLYTQEKQLLVMHDAFLSRITDINMHTQFKDRLQLRIFQGKRKVDWWVDQFTLRELKTLKIKQDQAPGRLTIFDFKFTFPTLEDVIKLVIRFNQQHKGKRNLDNRLAGMLIEAKNPQMFRELYGYNMAKDILDLLAKYGLNRIQNSTKFCPIYLHSFDYQTIKYWGKNTQLPNNYLIEGAAQFNLTDINLYATGIGFEDSILWDYTLAKPKETLAKTKQLGMLVHIWTFKDDQLLFNSTGNIQMYEIAQNTLELDGVITQFADIYAPLSQMLKKNKLRALHLRYQL